MKKRWLGLLGGLAAVGAGGVVVYRFLLRPWHVRWGATDEEVARPMPGDEVIDEPTFSSTRAITLHATPEDIWPWLVQLGRGRGGFYSYDWLEKLMGLGITSSDRILPEFQRLAPGDEIPAAPGYAMPVRAVEPPRFLVIGPPADGPQDTELTWSLGLYPRDDGTTRLVVRLRSIYSWRPGEPLVTLFIEPGHFVMERRMLRGIKRRAEALAEHRREPRPESGVLPAGV
ncbi:hypothetical protein NR798_17235 [Archangium gephyra]|uniref:hypothetical protein n=1 Tax=Archangium gephyra TaxID=48 RepID=UPI0035D4AC7B